MSTKSIPSQINRPFENLLAAIVRDERGKVKTLLRTSPELVRELVTRARCYETGICHWLYVSDTALHLAAAGFRSEIVRMLLSAGAIQTLRTAAAPRHFITRRMDISWGRPGMPNNKSARSVCCWVLGPRSTHTTKTAQRRSTAPCERAVPPL